MFYYDINRWMQYIFAQRVALLLRKKLSVVLLMFAPSAW